MFCISKIVEFLWPSQVGKKPEYVDSRTGERGGSIPHLNVDTIFTAMQNFFENTYANQFVTSNIELTRATQRLGNEPNFCQNFQLRPERQEIRHFRVHVCLLFKASLSAKFYSWKSVFIHM